MAKISKIITVSHLELGMLKVALLERLEGLAHSIDYCKPLLSELHGSHAHSLFLKLVACEEAHSIEPLKLIDKFRWWVIFQKYFSILLSFVYFLL